MRRLGLLLGSFLTLCFAGQARAYYAVLDNGEVLKKGTYKVTGDLQLLTRNGGANVGARFDMGVNEDSGVRAILGTGQTDIFLGGEYRWMPVPDLESQPAMGVNFGALWAKDGPTRDFTFRIEPLLSKRIEINSAVWTPYAAIPIGMRLRNSSDSRVDEDTKGTFQLALGSQLQVEKWKKLQFMFEIGLDIDNSPGYVAGAAVFYWDGETGWVLE